MYVLYTYTLSFTWHLQLWTSRRHYSTTLLFDRSVPFLFRLHAFREFVQEKNRRAHISVYAARVCETDNSRFYDVYVVFHMPVHRHVICICMCTYTPARKTICLSIDMLYAYTCVHIYHSERLAHGLERAAQVPIYLHFFPIRAARRARSGT